MRLPYPHHVGEEAKQHERIDGALVLEQHVEQRLLPAISAEKSRSACDCRKSSSTKLPAQRASVAKSMCAVRGRRQYRLELARGVLDLGEGLLEQGIVDAGRHRRATMPEARGVWAVFGEDCQSMGAALSGNACLGRDGGTSSAFSSASVAAVRPRSNQASNCSPPGQLDAECCGPRERKPEALVPQLHQHRTHAPVEASTCISRRSGLGR